MHYYYKPSSIAIVLAIVVQGHAAPLIPRQSSNNTAVFHHRAYHNSIVVENNGNPYLYIDGGEITYWSGRGNSWQGPNGTDPENYADYNTYSLPLDKSWTLADAPLKPIGKHRDFSYLNAALWPSVDGSSFYSYGGAVSWATQLYGWPSLENWYWQFTPDTTGGNWDVVPPNVQSNFSILSRSANALYGSGNGLGFALGGTESTQTNYGLFETMDIQGLVMYNDTSQQWWNLSSTGYSYSGTAHDGAAHFVPIFGPEGLLFVFGGYANGRPAPFDYVYFFEPVSQQWRKEEVSGTPPLPVTNPCVVGVEGDNGTYEIFLHGGLDTELDLDASIALGAVWSFSLPAFNWQMHSSDSAFARTKHSCNVAGNRQMMVVGGQVSTASSTLENVVRDPWPQGVGIYDLSALSWSDGFSADADAYITSDAIKAYYEANGSIPDSMTDPDVRQWFLHRASTASTSSPKDLHKKTNTDTNTGAITGGVVGGVVVLAVTGGILWFLVRRRRRSQQSVGNDRSDDYQKAELDTEQRARLELDGRAAAELPGGKSRHELLAENRTNDAVQVHEIDVHDHRGM